MHFYACVRRVAIFSVAYSHVPFCRQFLRLIYTPRIYRFHFASAVLRPSPLYPKLRSCYYHLFLYKRNSAKRAKLERPTVYTQICAYFAVPQVPSTRLTCAKPFAFFFSLVYFHLSTSLVFSPSPVIRSVSGILSLCPVFLLLLL